MSSLPDALVIGGGPAGCAAAISLARIGRTVALVEQNAAAHHKVCGEFLSREAIDYLGRLGIDLHSLGAVPIHSVRLAARREIAACDLPFPALSLTRRTLDEALLAMAVQSSAVVRRGDRINELNSFAGRFKAGLSGGDSLTAKTAFLATGKHDLNGHRRSRGRQSDLVAFKMYFRLSSSQQRALSGFVELYLFPGGYAGLQSVENGEANLCLVLNRATLRQCENHWPAILDHLRASSDLLAQRLDSAQPLLEKPLALSSIPYGYLRTETIPDLWPLGDQTAVIPSFSGDGISIALHSARVAVDLYSSGAASANLVHRIHKELAGSVALSTTLSRLMIAAPALAQAARLWPPLLALIASRTRIPGRALQPEALATQLSR